MQRALEGAVLTETFPKTVVDVYCTVLEAGGAELPATVCACSAALAEVRRWCTKFDPDYLKAPGFKV